MEIDKIAPAAASGQSIPGTAQSSGAQNSQIEDLQRLADSIRSMENECRITARVQGLSGSGLQTKLHQYDELLEKIKEQIRRLEHKDSQAANAKNGGVSMLQYNTSAAQIAMRNSGKTTAAAISDALQSHLTSAAQQAVEQKIVEQTQAAAKQAEVQAEKQVKTQNTEQETQGSNAPEIPSLDMLV